MFPKLYSDLLKIAICFLRIAICSDERMEEPIPCGGNYMCDNGTYCSDGWEVTNLISFSFLVLEDFQAKKVKVGELKKKKVKERKVKMREWKK